MIKLKLNSKNLSIKKSNNKNNGFKKDSKPEKLNRNSFKIKNIKFIKLNFNQDWKGLKPSKPKMIPNYNIQFNCLLQEYHFWEDHSQKEP